MRSNSTDNTAGQAWCDGSDGVVGGVVVVVVVGQRTQGARTGAALTTVGSGAPQWAGEWTLT